ncbi:DUF3298 and DUF4163 domain-containing protein [Sphingobacterium bovistauri]|uniref:DUF3298 domain-containing protein n=1 Tax=Sphingobacterium bovistauri TaxID=2781959 RepID=A0ABS7Z433_9SPHI|nr:DUF3298 and DUF4163 domain-containing protein [Sphingobacterium bovistauri]MCA5004933.1 DUF3298 domain-containing protein [Sphingobacterium bovistauri]
MIKLLSLFTIILFSSCYNEVKKTHYPEHKSATTVDTIQYTYNVHKNISSYVVENEGKLDTAYYQITYPIFDDINFNQLVNPYILIDGEESFETAAESFILGYNEFVEESSTNNISYPWYKDVKCEILTNTSLFVTLATAVDEYTGGAHGNHYTILSNIDIKNKKRIAIKDIIQDNKLDQLTKIAETQFRENEKIPDSISLDKDFFFENGIFAINDNFGLTKTSLIIYFNEYEIRPYAEGPTLLEIPYTDVKNILNPLGQDYVNSIM